MDTSALEEFMYDPSTCSRLSLQQKRELVIEVSKWPDVAFDILHAWSRQEILQILCAEMGKERKYTGLTKLKIIELLLKIIKEKKHGDAAGSELQENDGRINKRQRKCEQTTHVPFASTGALNAAHDFNSGGDVYCKNSACRALMSSRDVFCKRCSCCICHQFDDNKDPSLWLTCCSDPPFLGLSCGISCHLECSLRHENSGISQDRQDGSFCCVSCGKVNDLLGSWKKQLLVASDTRRVDILCYRLSLAHKILAGTKHYQNLHGIVDEAVAKLEDEVGPLTGLPVKKARGIVNRLSSGPEIQKLCASAMESLELILSDPSPGFASEFIRLQDVSASSVWVTVNYCCSDMENIIGCSLWYRKAGDLNYPTASVCSLFKPNSRFLLSGLSPSTKYLLKAAPIGAGREKLFEFQFETTADDLQRMNSENHLETQRSQSPATNCSSLSNPSSVEDETNVVAGNGDAAAPGVTKKADEDAALCLLDGECSRPKKPKNPRVVQLETVPSLGSSEPDLFLAPSRIGEAKHDCCRSSKDNGAETSDKVAAHDQVGSSTKRRQKEGAGKQDFEYYVKVIRWLECEGHLEKEFRQKFLTWYSLGATEKEIRVAKAFIDAFIEDPEALAGQLLDTFSEAVSNQRCSNVPGGFCMKLWH